MAHDGEGKIYIPLEEFWKFVQKWAPGDGTSEIRFGVPQFTESDVVIDYAFSTEGPPEDWATPPKAITQWDDLRKAEKMKAVAVVMEKVYRPENQTKLAEEGSQYIKEMLATPGLVADKEKK